MRFLILCFIFLFQVQSVIPPVTGQNHSKYLHFMFLKDIFVVLQTFIFLGVFTIWVTMAAPHLKFSTRLSPLIILTQQSFGSNFFFCFGRFKEWFGTKAAKIADFGHLNFMFGY